MTEVNNTLLLERNSEEHKVATVKPCFMDTRLMWTPHYYGQFSLSLGKAHTFSLNSTCLIEAIQIVKATRRRLI